MTERNLTPFVGRDAVLAGLLEVLAAARAGHGQALNVMAEPGLGKSRLLLELRRGLGRERVTFLEGRCLSFGAATPYLPVIDIVRANAGIEPGDPVEAISSEGAARAGGDRHGPGSRGALPAAPAGRADER